MFFAVNNPEAIITEIGAATNQVLVQSYSFTSAQIAMAQIAAKSCGVSIRVILDSSQRTGKYSAGDFLVHTGGHSHISRHGQVILNGSAAGRSPVCRRTDGAHQTRWKEIVCGLEGREKWINTEILTKNQTVGCRPENTPDAA